MKKQNEKAVYRHGFIAGIVVILGAVLVMLFLNPFPSGQNFQDDKKVEVLHKSSTAPNERQLVVEKELLKPEDETAMEVVARSENENVTEKQTNDGLVQRQQKEKEKPIFESPSDQILAMAISGEPGQEIPPLPIGPEMEEDFRESLKVQIIINDDDPDDVKELKQLDIEAREVIKEHLDAGETVESILKEHQETLKAQGKVRRDCAIEYRRLLESGDVEGAEKYLSEANEALEQMGIPAVYTDR